MIMIVAKVQLDYANKTASVIGTGIAKGLVFRRGCWPIEAQKIADKINSNSEKVSANIQKSKMKKSQVKPVVKEIGGQSWSGQGTAKCSSCENEVDKWDLFPGGICLKCHARKVFGKPLEKPNFVGTINKNIKEMKMKKSQVKEIIKEEVTSILKESSIQAMNFDELIDYRKHLIQKKKGQPMGNHEDYGWYGLNKELDKVKEELLHRGIRGREEMARQKLQLGEMEDPFLGWSKFRKDVEAGLGHSIDGEEFRIVQGCHGWGESVQNTIARCKKFQKEYPKFPSASKWTIDESDGSTEKYDRMADQFYRETGMMAPGKDVPAGLSGKYDFETRSAKWDEWIQKQFDANAERGDVQKLGEYEVPDMVKKEGARKLKEGGPGKGVSKVRNVHLPINPNIKSPGWGFKPDAPSRFTRQDKMAQKMLSNSGSNISDMSGVELEKYIKYLDTKKPFGWQRALDAALDKLIQGPHSAKIDESFNSHGSVAKSVRLNKEKHPENYCANPKCLWNTRAGTKPCPKHPVKIKESVSKFQQTNRMKSTYPCGACGKLTRDTGQGEGPVDLCVKCYNDATL